MRNVFVVLALLCATNARASEPLATAQDMASDPIEFHTLREAEAMAIMTGKPVMIVFEAVWCAACRKLKAETLPDPGVQAMSSSFHWARVDIDRELTIARDYAVRATPQFVVQRANGEIVSDAVGALPPSDLLAFLNSSLAQSATTTGGFSEFWAPLPATLEIEMSPLTWSPSGYRGHSICFSHVGYGPLRLPSQAPGQVLRLGLVPRTPSTLAKGDVELRWSESLANLFGYKVDDYLIDFGTLSSTLSVGYGISDSVQVELAYHDLARHDSILDPITNAFHDVFGFGDAGRDDFSEGDNQFFVKGEGGASDISNGRVGSISRDLALTVQHNITCGSDSLPALAYSVTARHHTGGKANLTGSSPWSVGLNASASRRFGEDYYGYLGMTYMRHGLDRWETIRLKKEQLSGLVAFEWRYQPQSSWVIQYLLSEGVATDRRPFSENANEISLGWKRELKPGVTLELGIIENAVVADNSPDFGLHFGLVYRR